MSKKVLLIRLDKIGDLVCTLCVDQIPEMQSHSTHWLIAKGLGFVPDHAQPPRSYTELDKSNWKLSLKSLLHLLKSQTPDIAVSFQAPWWVNFALWLARVPVRAGVRSQWHSYLFLNKGLRQKRSQAIQHEADYNCDLLRYALESRQQGPTPVLQLTADIKQLPSVLHEQNYIVVHAGMAGSALNWGTHNYIELIKSLRAKGKKIVLTGTPADEQWLSPIKEAFAQDSGVINLQSQLNASQLLAVLAKAQALVAPSTGVLHLAASLGTLCVGIYSPIKVQHPTRWQARGPRVLVHVPDGSQPEHFVNLDSIRPQAIVEQIL